MPPARRSIKLPDEIADLVRFLILEDPLSGKPLKMHSLD